METKRIESKVVLSELLEDLYNQAEKFPKLTILEVADAFFLEKHEIAFRFQRFHKEVSVGFTHWREEGNMKEDFELLFEYVERGYAQKIRGFDNLLNIFEDIRDMGNPENFHMVKNVKVTCEECDGDGGTYVYGKCTHCNGMGRIKGEIVLEGKEDYHQTFDTLNEKYLQLNEIDRLQSFEEFINRIEDDEVKIEKAIVNREKKKQEKPDCKLIGEDGNVFNLLHLVSRTLNREGMKKEAKEMQERVWASGSYGEALNIFGEYVDIC